jgi:hypothetical protein
MDYESIAEYWNYSGCYRRGLTIGGQLIKNRYKNFLKNKLNCQCLQKRVLLFYNECGRLFI